MSKCEPFLGTAASCDLSTAATVSQLFDWLFRGKSMTNYFNNRDVQHSLVPAYEMPGFAAFPFLSHL